jgi:circadian clock protein KaiB
VDCPGSHQYGIDVSKYHLRLYVIGRSPRSQVAIANLEALVKQLAGSGHDYEVFDILEQPDLAEQERLLATPTLIKVKPPPSVRVIGDLSDTLAVAEALGLHLDSRSMKD